MDKYLLVVAVILGIYLNRTYALMFDFPKNKALTSPFTQSSFTLDNPQASGSAKYVALGDSLTAGVGSQDYQQTLPYLFSQILSQKYNQTNLVILSKPGAVTNQVLEQQLPLAINEKPDYVTLLIGINDMRSFSSLDNFTDHYYQIGKQLTEKTTAKLIFFNLPYLGSDQITYPPYNWIFDYRTRQYNNIIKETAAAFGAQYIDLYTPTQQHLLTKPEFYSADLFHPSAKGYILWANLLNAL